MESDSADFGGYGGDYGGHAGDGVGEVGSTDGGFSDVADAAAPSYDDTTTNDDAALADISVSPNFDGFEFAKSALNVMSTLASMASSPLGFARGAMSIAEQGVSLSGGRSNTSYSTSNAPSYGGGDFYVNAAPANFDKKVTARTVMPDGTYAPIEPSVLTVQQDDVSGFAVNASPNAAIIETDKNTNSFLPVVLGLLIIWGVA